MAVGVESLTAKVDSGEPFSDEEIDALGATRDIITLGMLATAVRRRLHASTVTYVRVADLKLGTTTPADAGGPEDLMAAFRSAENAGELRMFQTPGTLDEAIEVVTRARDLAGATPLSAFCLFELSKFPEGLPVVLPALKSAGLEWVAQAPLDRLSSPEPMLEALADAGLQLARLTINDTPSREWTAVCREVAALQTRLRSIRVFAPLARRTDQSQPTTGYEDVKRVALSRLMAGDVETIQVDWALYGPKLAQVALTFGADDIDSVSSEDNDSQGRRRSTVEEITRGIRTAGYEPVERDGRFERRD